MRRDVEPARFVPAALWAALLFFLSSRESFPGFFATVLGVPNMDKVVHAGFYAILTAWLLFGARGPRGRAAWVWAAVASMYGVTDEIHQHFVPGRSVDVLDWAADSLGAIACVAVWLRAGPTVRRLADNDA